MSINKSKQCSLQLFKRETIVNSHINNWKAINIQLI
jgi:hypothetical protein